MQKCEQMEGVHIYKNVARVRGALNIRVSMHGVQACENVRAHEVLHPCKNVQVHPVRACRDWSKCL